MTIDEMPAGREMDALVAEKVMGWKREWVTNSATLMRREVFCPPGVIGWISSGEKDGIPNEVPYYSTSISAAWEVVEKMEADGVGCKLSNYAPGWRAEFYKNEGDAGADTAALAICRSALRAVSK